MAPRIVALWASDETRAGVRRLQDAGYDVVTVPPSSTDAEVEAAITGADAIFTMSCQVMTRAMLLAAGPQLKIIATMSAGYDHIDVNACAERNVIVTHCLGLNAEEVAEFTVGMAIAAGRRVVEGDRVSRLTKISPETLSTLKNRGLRGSTVGIVGMGRIGLAVLKRLIPFKVAKFIYHDVFHPIAEAEQLGASYAPLEELLQQSDYVSIHCNLTPENTGLFNRCAFQLMKSSAILVNTSRGKVVDHDDLYEALRTGEIRAAALDVTEPEPLPLDHPLLTLTNCVVTPHIASADTMVLDDLAETAADNIIAVLKGGEPLSPVPLP